MSHRASVGVTADLPVATTVGQGASGENGARQPGALRSALRRDAWEPTRKVLGPKTNEGVFGGRHSRRALGETGLNGGRHLRRVV